MNLQTDADLIRCRCLPGDRKLRRWLPVLPAANDAADVLLRGAEASAQVCAGADLGEAEDFSVPVRGSGQFPASSPSVGLSKLGDPRCNRGFRDAMLYRDLIHGEGTLNVIGDDVLFLLN